MRPMPDQTSKEIIRLMCACARALAAASNTDRDNGDGNAAVLLNAIGELANMARARLGAGLAISDPEDLNGLIKTVVEIPEISRELGPAAPDITSALFSAAEPYKPVDFQTPLLTYLLFMSRDGQVIGTVENFVAGCRDQLATADFQRTRTGATRCFTNVRFAAATLHHYGLIRNEFRRGHKRWDVTLLGLLVADALAADGAPSLEIKRRSVPRVTAGFPLSPDIGSMLQRFADSACVEERLNALVSGPTEGFQAIAKRLAAFCHKFVAVQKLRIIDKEDLDRLRNESEKLSEDVDAALGWQALKDVVRSAARAEEVRCLRCASCRFAFAVNLKSVKLPTRQTSLFESSAVECPACSKGVEFSLPEG